MGQALPPFGNACHTHMSSETELCGSSVRGWLVPGPEDQAAWETMTGNSPEEASLGAGGGG